MNWYEKFQMKQKMLRLAKKIAPTGTVHWMSKGMEFQFFNGKQVWVSVESEKTGVKTYIWSSGDGFKPICADNTFLIKWFYDALELLEAQLILQEKREKEIQTEIILDLLDQFENAYREKEVEVGSMM